MAGGTEISILAAYLARQLGLKGKDKRKTALGGTNVNTARLLRQIEEGERRDVKRRKR